MPVEL